MKNDKIVIASRNSPLARAQAHLVVSNLNKAGIHNVKNVFIKSKGDNLTQDEFKHFGGKGLFTKEIDQLVIEKKIDLGIHSAKDIPGILDPRLKIGAYLKRDNVRDVIITKKSSIHNLMLLPKNITLGTSSPRRSAYVNFLRPDIKIINIRGNIETRINKVLKTDLYSIILAQAALNRLNYSNKKLNVFPIPLSLILPSPGQGAVAVVYNKESKANKRLCKVIDCRKTKISLKAERALIKEINGDCFTPIAAHAKIKNNKLILNACLFSNDIKKFVVSKKIGPISSPCTIGKKCGKALLKKLK